jgi:hypothetical protein
VVRDTLDDGSAQRRVELQLLVVDDLVGLVVDELAPTDGADHGLHDDREPLEVDADDVAALPAGMAREGQLTARAAISVEGPGGTSVAQLLGDGGRWWQVGSAGPGRLRLVPVDAASLRASVVDALTHQLTAAATSAAGAGGGEVGG